MTGNRLFAARFGVGIISAFAAQTIAMWISASLPVQALIIAVVFGLVVALCEKLWSPRTR